MDLATWKANAHKRLATLARTLEDWAPGTLYGALAAMTLLPLTTSSDPHAALAALVSGVGLNLLTNQIEAWKTRSDSTLNSGDRALNRTDEKTLAAELTEQAKSNDELRDALDTILQKLDALTAVAQNLEPDDREDSLKQLDKQLKKVRSNLSIDNYINLSIAGNATNVIAGMNNQIINNQVYAAAEAFLPTLQTRLLPPSELQNATERYLTYLWDRYSILDIKGFGMADRVSLNLSLLEMYIPLRARIEMPEGDTWSQHLRLAGRKVTGEEAAVIGARVSEPLPLLELLAKHGGLIILGDPGAGKSTFLKYLALQLAQGQEGGLHLDKRLPILIPLAAYADAIIQTDMALQDFLGEYYRKQGLAELHIDALLRAALDNGQALLLFDGLDEVQQIEQRTIVVRRVEGFFALHRKRGNKFVLTSRIVGYRDAPLTAVGVQTCTLIDFDDDNMAEFAEKWSHIIEKAIKGDNAVTHQAAETEKDELLDALRRNAGVRQLAANPLLLTILALMKRQNVVLPERRVQLYEKYVETLLNSWNLARSLDRHHGNRHMETRDVLKVLAPLALWMKANSPGQGLMKQKAILRQLEEIYRQRQAPDPEQAAQELLAHARNYASLLLERGTGQYGFIHLTFLEYLAAVGLAQLGQQNIDPVVEQLARHVAESTWHEVTLLTVGYMGIVQGREEAAGDVVVKLMQSAVDKPGAAVVLAGEVVADVGAEGVGPACRQAVVDALLFTMIDDRQVVPRVRAAAGRALAKLGDPRFRSDAWYLPTDDLLGFVEIAAGEFVMGDSNEKHKVTLPTYYIARYPVTVAQFRAFVRDSNPRLETRISLSDPDNYPVRHVNWREALQYCRWLNDKLSTWKDTPTLLSQLLCLKINPMQIFLPSEAEWEKAARGVDERIFPWGDKPDTNRANYDYADSTGIKYVSTVGCFPSGISPYGVEEMSGNVWEWTRSLYATYPYPVNNPELKERESLTGNGHRVMRGGAFYYSADYSVRCIVRDKNAPFNRNDYTGFRVALSPSTSGL